MCVQVRLAFARCARFDTANVVTFNFCHGCGTSFAGAPVPRQPRAQPVTINERALHERRNEVLAATRDRNGQQRKCGFDRFVRVHTRGARGWVGAIDADVHDCLCWLDTEGAGNTVVHTRLCPGFGSATRDQCPEGDPCRKRYAYASLDKATYPSLVWRTRSS